jgi:cell division septum initiation protein DivIVA
MSAHGAGPEEKSHAASPDALRWQRSYDRASVDRYLAEVAAQRARLQAQIEDALAQRDAARAAIAARDAAAQAELGAIVLATQNELDRIETSHREVVETIQRAAETEAARVLAAARLEVDRMRDGTASLAGLVGGRRAAPGPRAHEDGPTTDHPSAGGRADAG